MHTEDKAALIVGASLIVIGLTGLVIIDRLTQKAAKKSSEEYKEQRMQQGWELLQRHPFFAKATPEQRIEIFDTYWKTTGGVKPHTP